MVVGNGADILLLENKNFWSNKKTVKGVFYEEGLSEPAKRIVIIAIIVYFLKSFVNDRINLVKNYIKKEVLNKIGKNNIVNTQKIDLKDNYKEDMKKLL